MTDRRRRTSAPLLRAVCATVAMAALGVPHVAAVGSVRDAQPTSARTLERAVALGRQAGGLPTPGPLRRLPGPVAVGPRGRQVSDPAAGTITTLAGGSADGAAPMASTIFQPWHALSAPNGDIVIVDTYNNRVRAYDPDGGVMRTIVGTGDAGYAGDGGPATNASLNFPLAAAFGPDGDLFIADTWSDAIRRVDAATGIITTFAGVGPNESLTGAGCGEGWGGPASSAQVCQPHGVAVDSAGNVYISSSLPSRVSRIDADTGTITEVATMFVPWGLAIDARDNLLISHVGNRIEYLNLSDATVTIYPDGPEPVVIEPGERRPIVGTGEHPVEGDEGDGGPATQAQIPRIKSFGVASDGDLLLADDAGVCCVDGEMKWSMLVRRVDWDTGIIRTIAGNKTLGFGGEDEDPLASPLQYPTMGLEAPDGDVLIIDRGNTRLRRIRKDTGKVRTEAGAVFGDGLPAPRAHLCWPAGVASGGGADYIADGCNLRVRSVSDGVIDTVGGSGAGCTLLGVAMWPCGTIGGDGGPATEAGFYDPSGLEVRDGLLASVSNNVVRILNVSNETRTVFPLHAEPIVLAPGEVERVAGSGETDIPPTGTVDARQAYIGIVHDVAFLPDGDLVFTDIGHHRIGRVHMQTGQLSLVAGSPAATQFDRDVFYLDGPAATARFAAPFGIAAASDGTVYVADTGNARVRKIDMELGVVTTIAGAGVHGFAGDGGPATASLVAAPEGISVAPDGAIIVTDTWNHRIRRIDPQTSVITTIAGSGPSANDTPVCGSQVPCGHYTGDGGPATSARLNFPSDAVVTADGRLLIADKDNHRIRVVQLA